MCIRDRVKARRDIEENLKLVDIVLMLVDARAPLSCRNPDLEHLARHKKIILILNKNDLADPNATRSFLGILHAEGLNAVAVNSVKGQGVREVVEVIQKAYESQRQDLLRRGRRIRPVRLMVTGEMCIRDRLIWVNNMIIDILTLFPDMFVSPLTESILKRAQEQELVNIRTVNIRDYAPGKHHQVDDYPYGGGAGMVMKADVIGAAVQLSLIHI